MRIQFSLVFRVLQSPREQVFILLSACIPADTRSWHDCLPLLPCHRSASDVSGFAHMAFGIFQFCASYDFMCVRTSRDRDAACLYVVSSSSQHQNHLLVVSHSMPKRRLDTANDFCNSRDIDQLKVLQQMQTSLGDIVSRMVHESSVESEIQPVSMHATSSSLL